jgi:hypothetical protein
VKPTTPVFAQRAVNPLAALYHQWSGMPPSAELQPGWELHAFALDGEPVAIAATSGHEIHFASDPRVKGRLVTRKRVKEFLGPLFEDKAFLITRVPVGLARENRFVKLMGFDRLGDDGASHNYMLSEMPFSKKKGV